MGYKPRKKPDDTLAPKLAKKSFSTLEQALILIGKPFYLFFSYTFILILLTVHITGHSWRKLLRTFSGLLRTKQVYPKPQLVRITESIVSFAETTKSKLATYKQSLLKSLLTKTKHLKLGFLKTALSTLSGLNYLLQPILKVFRKLPAIFFYLVINLGKAIVGTDKPLRKKLKLIRLTTPIKLFVFKLKIKLVYLISRLSRIRVPRFKLALATFSTIIIFSTLALSSFWLFVLRDLPAARELTTRQVDVSTKIYDRNGNLLYKIYKDQNRTPVTLDRIPAHVRLATIAIEDAEFYSHPGFSVRGIIRAVIRNIKRGELTGGSTITQQLVKNALLSPEKTIVRKLREIVLAVKVEFAFSKDEILEMYLNEVSYGGTAYGIQEATHVYFGKDVDQLTLGEAALLAGLPRSPTRFSPFGPNPEAASARQKEVLRLMKVNGYITTEQRKAAEEEEIVFAPNVIDIKAPHFVMYVRQRLVEKYGEEVVAKGGLEVFTSLDFRIQKLAEEVVSAEVEKLSSLNVGNGAALVIDTESGDILAMVGSKDYFDLEADGNVNLTTAERQPGSSIKVVNYSYALSNGYTPATILTDTPVTFSVPGQPPYSPRNYDNRYRGNLPLRNALAESRNIPAVRVLASYGVGKMIEQGRKMGITTWKDPSNYGLSLTLGGGEVKLTELAGVYTTIANYGKRQDLVSVLKVTNYEGKVLEENGCLETDQVKLVKQENQNNLINPVHATESAIKTIDAKKVSCEGEQVIDPRVAYLIIDILKDNRARSPAFGSNSLLVIPNRSEVAVKTGTSNDLRDNLAIGFNQKYLVAAWVGNNDNSPMSRVASGITGATPIFHKIISALLANEENHDWTVPDGLVQVPICPITGTLPCKGCPIRIEWFLEESQPEKTCSPEFIEKLKEKEEEKEEKEKPRFPIFLPADRQGEILEPAFRIER